jgi:tripartite ATP-independent transporter DctM subunit
MAAQAAAAPATRVMPLLAAMDGTSRVVGAVSGLGILVIAFIVGSDVFLRYVFNEPTTWADEISTYIMIGAVFLGAAYTHLADGHIRVDLVTERLPRAIRDPLEVVTTWLGFVFVAFMAWQCYTATAVAYATGAREFSLLVTPSYLPQIPIAVGMHLFALQMLAGLARRRPDLPASRVPAAIAVVVAVTAVLVWVGLQGRADRLAQVGLGTLVLAAGIAVLIVLLSGLRTAAIVAAILGAGAVLFHASRQLTIGQTMLLFSLGVLVFLLAGVRVSLGLGLIGLLGIYFLLPAPQPITLGERAWATNNSFTLTAIPLFVLMGEFLLRSGVSDDLFSALVRWIGRWPGGLSHAAMVACSIFAAVSGSSVATAATIGTVASPEMIKRGYSPRLTYGSLAAGGTLGILIPPSIVMLLYGSMMGVSIAACLIAGIIPGIILTGCFMLILAGWSLLNPSAAPKGPVFTWSERLRAAWAIVPVVLLIFLVLGTIYLGVATPTEAGAVGCLGAVAICLVRRRLAWDSFWGALLASIRTNSFIFVIITGAAISSFLLDYLRVPAVLVETIRDLGLHPWVVMLVFYALYVALGCVIDGISMMVLTLPVIFPAVVALGFDPVWFAVVLTLLIELGLITPPVGLNLYVLQGISGGHPMRDIVIGAIPFMFAMVLVIALVSFFPILATWLPGLMLK